jgi:hypothetical protein
MSQKSRRMRARKASSPARKRWKIDSIGANSSSVSKSSSTR